MSRRDWHTLAAYATIAALLVAVAVFVVMLTAVLDKAAADSAPITPRATPSVASRDFARPFLTAPPSDHAAAGRDQTSPSASASAAVDRRSVAAVPPALSASAGEAGQEDSEIADEHGTIKQRIAWCESRGDVGAINPVSGASGAWQWLDSTWHEVTGLPGKASDYPLPVQSEAFDELFAQQGTKPWNASKSCWGDA